MKARNIILASASPRRKELIRYINHDVIIIPSKAEEAIEEGVANEEIPIRFALLKAHDVAKEHFTDVVIGCDTVVIVDDIILGKPKNRADGRRMLHLLSGKAHRVITGCAIICGNEERYFSETSEVTFYPLTDDEIESYLDFGEYADKAGSYAIQGKGMLFVRTINGDYPNIVGLPVARLSRELDDFLTSISKD